jgi:hypothetical protein
MKVLSFATGVGCVFADTPLNVKTEISAYITPNFVWNEIIHRLFFLNGLFFVVLTGLSMVHNHPKLLRTTHCSWTLEVVLGFAVVVHLLEYQLAIQCSENSS